MTAVYGVRQDKELSAAKKIAAVMGIEHLVVDLTSATKLMKGSSLTDLSVPVAEGFDEDHENYVPNRNMILLSLAGALAISRKFDKITYGAWKTKCRDLYPDRRAPFITSAARTLILGNYEKVRLVVPFASYDKSKIIQTGVRLKSPMGASWSCYNNFKKHCGTCYPCIDRKRAFAEASCADPTEYLK